MLKRFIIICFSYTRYQEEIFAFYDKNEVIIYTLSHFCIIMSLFIQS